MSMDFVAAIRRHINEWPGEFVENIDFIKALNINGTAMPVFWCFQTATPFERLAAELGQEVPLFGLRSGHQVMNYSQENIQLLTELYASSIIAVCKLRNITQCLIAGNCQGAGLMLHVASILNKRSTLEFKILVLESVVPVKNDIAVTLVYGRQSSFNPFRRYHEVGSGLASYYSDFKVYTIFGAHGQFFRPDTVQNIASVVKRTISQRYLLAEHNATPEVCSNRTYDLSLMDSIQLEHVIWDAAAKKVVVKLNNATGAPISNSGLTLANQWLRKSDLSLYRWLDGHVKLPTLEPGFNQFEFDVTLPLVAGDYVLKVRLVMSDLGYREFDYATDYCVDDSLHVNIGSAYIPGISKSLCECVRQGRTDALLSFIASGYAFTKKQWRLISDVLFADDHWREALIINRVLAQRGIASIRQLISLMACLFKQRNATELLAMYRQHFVIHQGRNSDVNSIYLQAAVLLRDVDLFSSNFDQLVIESQHRVQVLHFLFNPVNLGILDEIQKLQFAGKLITLDKSLDSYLKVTAVYAELGKHEECSELLEQACEAYPENSTLALRAARMADKKQDKTLASIYFKQVIKLVPSNQEAKLWLANSVV